MAIPLMAAMAAAGLLKSQTIDKKKERADRRLAAQTQALSPWTGLKAEPIREADPVGSTLAFGMSGAQLDQAMERQEMDKALTQAQLDYMRSIHGRPWGMRDAY